MNKQKFDIDILMDKDFKDMTAEEQDFYADWRKQDAMRDMKENSIKTLYDHYKNTPKKLKIVCDWDEVIQAVEPYALWKFYTSIFRSIKREKTIIKGVLVNDYKLEDEPLPKFFDNFWRGEVTEYLPFEELPQPIIKYSPYDSTLEVKGTKIIKMYEENKNSPDFYQQAPFLTIAEDLLKLIKEDKVEQLIFLSAYDKRKFSDKDEDGDEIGDKRKYEIFEQTFDKLDNMHSRIGNHGREMIRIATKDKGKAIINFILSPFDGEKDERGTAWTSKADWIKQNASDFDLVIDDNPNICREIKMLKKTADLDPTLEIVAPYYPAIENQHDERVLLVKNEVSGLKKEDYGK